MVLNDLYHLYFRVQIHARSPILEYLTDPEFFSVVSVLFGGFYNGVCNGWYIAYDYNYEIYWRNYFDTESYLNRHIEIIQIATQYYGNVKSFENIMKMMYSEYNGQALIDDQIFIVKSIVGDLSSFLIGIADKFRKNSRELLNILA